jgi:hypothetical protein
VCELCNAPAFQLSAEALAEYKAKQQEAEGRRGDPGVALQPRGRNRWDQMRMVICLFLFLCVAGTFSLSAMGLLRKVG